MEELRKEYKTIVKASVDLESEIECCVRQKETQNIQFTNLIKAEKKLQEVENLCKNILNNFEKYKILEDDIKEAIEMSHTNNYRKKQYELDKKYMKQGCK